jgi:hypothetical protein
LKTSNLILDFEFDQHLGSHNHVGCYTGDARYGEAILYIL